MRRIVTTLLLSLLSTTLAAQTKEAGKETGKDAGKGLAKPACPDGRIDAFYIGHSLAYHIPDVVKGLFASRKGESGQLEFEFREHYIPGASLGIQFAQRDLPPERRQAQAAEARQGYWFEEFAKGGLDALVMIDSVPRTKSQMPETLDNALKLAKALLEKSPKARVLIYEPWHCVNSGTAADCEWDRGPLAKMPWRERLRTDAPLWDELVDDLAKALPKAKVALIPAGRALGMAFAAADTGTIDGFTSGREFFSDEIHLTPYGYYFVGLVHYAILSGQSPIGLTTDVADRWDRKFFDAPDHHGKTWKAPTAEARKRLQEIAWAAAQGKPDPGAGKGKKKAAGK